MMIRQPCAIAALFMLASTSLAEVSAPSNVPDYPWYPKAPPLPKAVGQVIRVKSVEELFQAASAIKPGGTIVVASGHYFMPSTLDLRADNITLRGETNHRNAVILDGARSRHGELLAITGCSGVTIADLTVQNIRWNAIKLNSDRKAHRVTIYNCVIRNAWQRGIKAPLTAEKDKEDLSPRDCRIQYCLFCNDRPKQFSDDPDDRADNFGGNYIGGIDIMQARGWTISDNIFSGIRGRTGEARGAVFLWVDCRDCIIERNVVVNCDTGICLGNSLPDKKALHCINCVVRNNFVTGAPEAGIFAGNTRNCKILHNTVHDPVSPHRRLIRAVLENEGLLIANNLFSGPPAHLETTSKVEMRSNVTKDSTSQFVNPAEGNLRLKTKVAVVRPLPEVTDDIDRQTRKWPTDVGASIMNHGGTEKTNTEKK